MRLRWLALMVLVVLGGLVALPLAGVVPTSQPDLSTEQAAVPTALAADVYGALGTTPAPDDTSLVAWTHDRDVQIFSDPTNQFPMLRLPRWTETGARRALLVVGQTPDRLQVLLPVRPNGTTGWVEREFFDLTTVHDELRVDLATHTLEWVRGSTVLAHATVVIGAPGTPTPRGRYFVTERYPGGGGAYGAWIFALNGFSETLESFNGAEPRIGIHGTNNPAAFGSSVSNGCVRVPSDVIEAMARHISAGTPVVIT